MPLEKCHLCKYALELELVTERCAFHATDWDPTIENEAHRAAHPHPADVRTPEAARPAPTWVPKAEPSCPYCGPSLPCTAHVSVPREHPTKRPYEPPAMTDVTDPEKARELALGFGIDLRADRGHSPIELVRARELDDLAVLVDDEAPKTPRDRGTK